MTLSFSARAKLNPISLERLLSFVLRQRLVFWLFSGLVTFGPGLKKRRMFICLRWEGGAGMNTEKVSKSCFVFGLKEKCSIYRFCVRYLYCFEFHFYFMAVIILSLQIFSKRVYLIFITASLVFSPCLAALLFFCGKMWQLLRCEEG